MKILIAIPAYNEEKALAKTLRGVKKCGYKNILVVNDGSTDNTKEVAQVAKAYVLSHYKNMGLGVGIRTAILFAKKQKYDALVTFDADGQHDAADIKKILKPVVFGKSDVVVGTRNYHLPQVPYIRRIILFCSNIYTKILFGIYSRDSQSGFRAMSRRAINSINPKGERMEISSEIFYEIKRHGLKYTEVPIKVIYTKYSLSKGQKNSNLFNVGFRLFLKAFR